MVQRIKVQCPAKINLGLKIVNRRPDGFHNIESVMQTVSLYDYLTIKYQKVEQQVIRLSGSSDEIPYDERNIVYKAIVLFLNALNIGGVVDVFIEKNIPVAAGLAGGSSDAAGVLLGLNELLGCPLSDDMLHNLCAQLGSDLNFCLVGGCKITSSRGEVLDDAEFVEKSVSLIKPRDLGISAKEAYTKFANKEKNMLRDEFANDLEWAVIDDYPQLQKIKQMYPCAIMTGSGSTYFAFDTIFAQSEDCWVKNGLKTVNHGVRVCQ